MSTSNVKEAFKEIINRKNVCLVVYSGLNLYLYEKVKDRRVHFAILVGSIIGLEWIWNYNDLVNQNDNPNNANYDYYDLNA